MVRFSHVTAGDTFTTAELQAAAAEVLRIPVEKFPLGGLRYELWKLRAKGVEERLPHSRRYRLLPNGYRIFLLFLKLFDRIYAPLTAGLLHPYPGDRVMTQDRLHQLDRLYQSVTADLDQFARRRRPKGGCMIQSLREQNSHWGPVNGLGFFADCAAKKWPFGAANRILLRAYKHRQFFVDVLALRA